MVARYISNGEADNIRDALRIEKERKDQKRQDQLSNSPTQFDEYTQNDTNQSNNDQVSSKESNSSYGLAGTRSNSNVLDKEEGNNTVEVSYSPATTFKEIEGWKTVGNEVESGTIDLMFVEAPLKHQFLLDQGYQTISEIAEQVLKPGGLLLTTVGHKSSMFIGEELRPIEPLHLLVLRRQPGNSRSIVGINITCASVILAMAYKKPFSSPSSMVVDLQTVENLDEVHSGLEKGIENFLSHLLKPDSNLLHMVCSKSENFKYRLCTMPVKKKLKVKQKAYRTGFSYKLSKELAQIDEEELDDKLSDLCWTLFENIQALDWSQFSQVIKALKVAIEVAEENTEQLEEILEMEKIEKSED